MLSTPRLSQLSVARDEMRGGELYTLTFPTYSGQFIGETLGEKNLELPVS